MAKYKKKKTSESAPATTDSNQMPAKSDTPRLAATETIKTTAPSKRARKMASGSVKLQFAGDLILVKTSSKTNGGLFKRYTELFEALANIEKETRYIIYRFLTCLILTSHARKTTKVEEKRRLFEQKNDFFVAMANERSLRKLFEFKYLVSKNFRVLKYCESCIKKNTEDGNDKHKWKYCRACDVDHNFYNLLSMEIKFNGGLARLFLSNDQIPRLKGFKLPKKIAAGELSEEAIFDRYHYNSRNLDAIDPGNLMLLYEKLERQPLAISQPQIYSVNKDVPKVRKTLAKDPAQKVSEKI
jgi:hypothetical protein